MRLTPQQVESKANLATAKPTKAAGPWMFRLLAGPKALRLLVVELIDQSMDYHVRLCNGPRRSVIDLAADLDVHT